MDGDRFDQIARTLAASAGRRELLKGAAAGVVAGVATWLGLADAAAARCIRYGTKCHHAKPCCSGSCQDDGYCGCADNADCDDGDVCTLDLCGPVSHICFHLPITGPANPCQACRHDRQCGEGGTCCHGRCCRDGAECQLNEQGIPVCCPTCENGLSCCEVISFDQSETSIGYKIDLHGCAGEGQCPGLPSFCCPGGGRYDPDCNGVTCESPVGGVF